MPVYDIPIPINTVEEAKELPSLTYSLDLESGRIVGKVDGLRAVQQSIKKALLTPRFKCMIYDNQYGSEIKAMLIDGRTSQPLIETLIPELVKDALKPDTRILGVKNFEFEFIGDSALIRFTVETIFGTANVEEVI